MSECLAVVITVLALLAVGLPLRYRILRRQARRICAEEGHDWTANRQGEWHCRRCQDPYVFPREV